MDMIGNTECDTLKKSEILLVVPSNFYGFATSTFDLVLD